MQLETKFAVNDLVQHKYNHQSSMVMEVMQIDIQICMGGVQVFYQCRLLVPQYKNSFTRPERFAGFEAAILKDNAVYAKFREDEIIMCSDIIAGMVKNPAPPEVTDPEDNAARITALERRLAYLKSKQNKSDDEGIQNQPSAENK